jgi:hypothetical protein
VATIALEPLVENAGRRLPPLPRPGAVTEEEPGAVELAIGILLQRHLARGLGEPAMEIAAPGFAGIDHGLELGGREQAGGDRAFGQARHVEGPRRRDRRHGGGFDEVGRMFARFGNDHARGAIVGIDPALLAHRRGFIEHLIGDRADLIGLRRPHDHGPRRAALDRSEQAEFGACCRCRRSFAQGCT